MRLGEMDSVLRQVRAEMLGGSTELKAVVQEFRGKTSNLEAKIDSILQAVGEIRMMGETRRSPQMQRERLDFVRASVKEEASIDDNNASPLVFLTSTRSNSAGRESDSNPWGKPIMLQEVAMKLELMGRTIEHIAATVGVKTEAGAGDDEEDRKRLKEKLREALDLDKRSRIRTIMSERELWLEYVFGICQPDGRLGKRGSRCCTSFHDSLNVSLIGYMAVTSWN